MKARDNPFRTERVHAIRYRPIDWTWEELDARLEESSYRGAIVGPQGSGKTTLLEDLSHRLESRGLLTILHTLRAGDREIPSGVFQQWRTSAQRIVLLDGAEQLAPEAWGRVLSEVARPRGLIITSHTEGLLPTLVRCRTSPELLDEILQNLLPPEVRARIDPLARKLFARHEGNIRLVLRSLYDQLAENEPGPQDRPLC